jgi:membrane protease YdiL (CAAX protease family)
MKATEKPLVPYGWLRALIYFIIVSVVVYLFTYFSAPILQQLGDQASGGQEGIFGFGALYIMMGAAVFIITWLMRKFIDRQTLHSLGFNFSDYTNEAGQGFFAALALLGIGSLVLIATGFSTFSIISPDPALLFVELGLMLVVAFVEELLFRGYLLNNLLQSMNKWIALILSSVLFAIFHISNPDVTVFALLNIVLAGLILGLNYIFTKNLWFGICFHFAWNFFQGPVLGYDVSGLKLSSLLQQTITGPDLWTGGTFGFEGSLLCFLLLLLAVFTFSFLFIKKYKAA